MHLPIYIEDNNLTFIGTVLATRKEYETADRAIGSIFEALTPGESIILKEGLFLLDDDLDLVNPSPQEE